MATSDGSKKIDPSDAVEPRRARTAAEQRADRTSSSNDPEVLAEEIERTREELAETLDAIADKVSPSRVKARTKQKVSDAVKEKTDAAKEGASHAKEQLQDKVEHVKEQAQEKAEQVQEKVSGSDDPQAVEVTAVAATTGTLADRAEVVALVEPVEEPVGADVPPAAPLGTAPVGGVTTYGASPSVPKEALAGGAAAVAVVLFLLGRRRRQRNRGWKAGAKR